jgi:ATP-dependent DNA helicase DinG
MTKDPKKIDPKALKALLETNGRLSRAIKGFETRQPQLDMLEQVSEAYNNNAISLIEAGTGTGKSLAYLIPAIAWAAQHGEATVIATNTITLQEQLLNKDIPFLLKHLNLKMKAVLLKGMSNYLCLRKFDEMIPSIPGLPEDEAKEFSKIAQWKQSTKEGSKSELTFVPSSNTWEQVCAESDTCNGNQCPFFQECHFFKARQKAAGAQILVANHHLLFADLAIRAETNNYEKTCLIPAYKRVVIDEAHHIEAIATDYFSNKVSRMAIIRTMAKIASDRAGVQRGKLHILRQQLKKSKGKVHNHEVEEIANRLQIQLPGLRQEVLEKLSSTFQYFTIFMDFVNNPAKEVEAKPESKLRLKPPHLELNEWTDSILTPAQVLVDSIRRYAASLSGLQADIEALDISAIEEATRNTRYDLKAFAQRLDHMANTLSSFIASEQLPDCVRWFERQELKYITNTQVVSADLDVSKALVDYFFSRFSTIVMCSATLATNKDFNFIKSRLGLNFSCLKEERVINESIYQSPFNYQKQAMLCIANDMPSPAQSGFTEEAVERIWQAILASRGNTFVLFTSYSMLKKAHYLLQERLKKHRYTCFKQGDANRIDLLNAFKKTDYSVLFGTSSFWEGVDVAGEALRCVILVKLPFQVPNEPIIEARCEAIAEKGGNAFFEYVVPDAIVRFKQGFGRLIRNQKDRGCIICLDPRLATMRYGKLFLNSLPPCQVQFSTKENFQGILQDFYKRTYHLTK